MYFYNCLCENCECEDECKYYEETVQPIVKSAESLLCNPNDEFEIGIYNLLNSFKCEYYEEKEEI